MTNTNLISLKAATDLYGIDHDRAMTAIRTHLINHLCFGSVVPHQAVEMGFSAQPQVTNTYLLTQTQLTAVLATIDVGYLMSICAHAPSLMTS